MKAVVQLQPANRSSKGGFTLIEVLVTVSIIAALASLVLPGLIRSQSRARIVVCASNLRQHQIFAQLYANENNGRLVPNTSHFDGAYWRSDTNSWVGPNNAEVDYSSASIVGAFANLAGESLFTSVLKCPSDRSRAKNTTQHRVRSYALNSQLGGNVPQKTNGTIRVVSFQESIVNPSHTMSFITEHENTIDDGAFLIYPQPATVWANMPSSRHFTSENVGLFDGAVISRKWLSSKIARRLRATAFTTAAYPTSGTDRLDLQWAQTLLVPTE